MILFPLTNWYKKVYFMEVLKLKETSNYSPVMISVSPTPF